MTSDLLAEKEFLLRSLRDLEEERAAGDIDDDDYFTLKQDYTARAAAVLKALDGDAKPAGRRAGANGNGNGKAAATGATASGRSRSWRRPVLIGAVVVVLAALGGWAVASSAGDRTPGQNITGTAAGASSSAGGGTIEQLLAQASDQASQNKILDAIKTYDQVLKQDPKQPEALAYRGWLLHLANLDANALDSLNKAVAADPSYPDAHFFRGEVLCTYSHDQAGALAEYQRFLDSKPSPDFASLVQGRLQAAQAGGCAASKVDFGPPPPGSAPATTPTTKP